ncbi:MAG TPA: GNAT family N-acetyltransferase [Clostridia bacterium]|nr:GNAT family N-acetyltransferase [Clostridia bacterium]
MEIRMMAISDYEKVHELWTNTAGMGMRSLDDSKEGIAKFLKRNPNTNFVAIIDDTIVGVILSGHDGRRGYIYHTAVEIKYRGNGIGKSLVDKALEALEKEGINKVALVVFKNNDIGNAFWYSIGFEERVDLNYRNKSINIKNI